MTDTPAAPAAEPPAAEPQASPAAEPPPPPPPPPVSKVESSSSVAALPRSFSILKKNNFCTNTAKTARFTPLNYLPLALSDVFDPRYKITNLYFVVAGALQLIPRISLTAGTPTIWINLATLTVQDILIMGFADIGKHRADSNKVRTPPHV